MKKTGIIILCAAVLLCTQQLLCMDAQDEDYSDFVIVDSSQKNDDAQLRTSTPPPSPKAALSKKYTPPLSPSSMASTPSISVRSPISLTSPSSLAGSSTSIISAGHVKESLNAFTITREEALLHPTATSSKPVESSTPQELFPVSSHIVMPISTSTSSLSGKSQVTQVSSRWAYCKHVASRCWYSLLCCQSKNHDK